MFAIAPRSGPPTEKYAQPHVEHLEDILVSMLEYGRPRVTFITGSKSGWYCHIEMNVNSTGVNFEVKSDFDHGDPTSAARQCRERALKAISVYKE